MNQFRSWASCRCSKSGHVFFVSFIHSFTTDLGGEGMMRSRLSLEELTCGPSGASYGHVTALA